MKVSFFSGGWMLPYEGGRRNLGWTNHGSHNRIIYDKENSDIQLLFKPCHIVFENSLQSYFTMPVAMQNDQFEQIFPSDYASTTRFLLTIFLIAAFEWFAAVDMSSSDSVSKKEK